MTTTDSKTGDVGYGQLESQTTLKEENTAPPAQVTNYVAVTRSVGTISGHYTIDPTLEVASSLLPHVVGGEKRKNLSLHTSLGTISTDITIVHNKEKPLPQNEKVELETRCTGAGTVSVRIHCQDDPQRARFNLQASSACGTVDVYIPRSFRGPVVISGFSLVQSITFSEAVRPALRLLQESSGKARYFIGEYPASEPESALAQCDELTIVAKCGAVLVKYEEEYVEH